MNGEWLTTFSGTDRRAGFAEIDGEQIGAVDPAEMDQLTGVASGTTTFTRMAASGDRFVHVAAITSSVSKTIAPALRIGWMGAPPELARELGRQLVLDCATPDVVQQHALAVLIDSGRYDRVIRARRQTYQRRRAILLGALDGVPGCEAAGAPGGLHLTLLLPAGVDEDVVVAALLARGIWAPPLGRYRSGAGQPGLVVSYASITDRHAERFAAALREVLEEMLAGS